MFPNVVFDGKERRVAAAIAEHFEKLLVPIAVRRGKHQEHNTEVILNVLLREPVVFLEKFDAPTRCPIQTLPIRMLAIPKRIIRLCINRFRRHQPEQKPPAEFQATHCLYTQQRLPTTCRYFKTDVRNRFTRRSFARDVFGHLPRNTRQHPLFSEVFPRFARVVFSICC